ncbi:MAG: 30S ribosomal protein S4e [Methanobacteriota archaeon]
MSKHLKRLAAPRTVRIHRKEHVWMTKPSPGPHRIEQSLSLLSVVRDFLQLCDLQKEAKRIIVTGNILVDGVKRKNHQFPCGFMDVVSLPELKKDYRVLFDRKGKLMLVPIPADNATWKLCRIENKTVLRGKKIQLNLHDGTNIIVPKDEYTTGDVLKIDLKEKKIVEVFPFKKGTVCMIVGGRHIGQTANIEDVEVVASSKPNLAKMKGITEFSTITEYVFPIGLTKPIIALPEVTM